MAGTNSKDALSDMEIERSNRHVGCTLVKEKVTSLSKYLEIVTASIQGDETFWFRGHRDLSWSLVPSALRYKDQGSREKALNLMPEFRRVAEIKLERPPKPDEHLKWLQLAQHYGIPTRLLDWTESAVFALFYAVVPPKRWESDTNGVVFMLQPRQLSRLSGRDDQTSLNAHLDESLIKKYFDLDAMPKKRGLPTIAIKPVWNSERLMMQRGVFTLHGSKQFDLDDKQVPSLIGIPIMKEYKRMIRRELDRIGIDEMMLFPELEYSCECLRRRAGLM